MTNDELKQAVMSDIVLLSLVELKLFLYMAEVRK